ncbi:MAG: ComEC/Rec2 family competence protein [Bdellovibrio sp.]
MLSLALILSIPTPSSLLTKASKIADTFQHACLERLPENLDHVSSLASLLCGEKIIDPTQKKTLIKTSLIHIFVVSGSHLLLWEKWMCFLRLPWALRGAFLCFYCLLVGWQAPAVRALLHLSSTVLLRTLRVHLPGDLKVLGSGLLCLILFPAWWQSLAFTMSWCASLALTLPGLFRLRTSWQRLAFTQFAIYFLMSAPLWGLGSLHPLNILYNFFLAPAVSFVLLPLAVLTWLCPSLGGFFDQVMEIFFATLPALSEPIVFSQGQPPQAASLWLWIFIWHIGLHFLRCWLWRGQDHSR